MQGTYCDHKEKTKNNIEKQINANLRIVIKR